MTSSSQGQSLSKDHLKISPRRLHRLAAALEMVTWSLLILGMALKYTGITEAVVPITGGIHGFGFLTFLVITTIVWMNNRWSFIQGVLGYAVSIVPFAAWPFTLWAERKGLLNGGWRFQNSSKQPQGLAELLLAQVVRHPWRSILVLFLLIAIVFTALITIGQPYDPEAIVNQR